MINSPFYALVSIQFKKFFREPAIIFWALIMPIAMSWLLGIAFGNKDAARHRYIVVGSPLYTSLTQSLSLPEPITKLINKEITWIQSPTEDEALLLVKSGKAPLFITGDTQKITYHLDPQNSEAVANFLALEYLTTPRAVHERSQVEILSKPGSRYIDFLIPGLIAMGIMSSCLWGTGYALIETRMKKMLKRLIITPMKKSTFLLSHLIVRIALSGIEALLLYCFSYFYFGLMLPASWFAFFFLFLCGNISFWGIAILVGSRADNSRVGNGVINFVQLPMLFLSGIFFSYQNYPDWIIPILEKLPLSLLADAFRSLIIDQGSFIHILPACFWLLLYGAITFFIGLKVFKWT